MNRRRAWSCSLVHHNKFQKRRTPPLEFIRNSSPCALLIARGHIRALREGQTRREAEVQCLRALNREGGIRRKRVCLLKQRPTGFDMGNERTSCAANLSDNPKRHTG